MLSKAFKAEPTQLISWVDNILYEANNTEHRRDGRTTMIVFGMKSMGTTPLLDIN